MRIIVTESRSLMAGREGRGGRENTEGPREVQEQWIMVTVSQFSFDNIRYFMISKYFRMFFPKHSK